MAGRRLAARCRQPKGGNSFCPGSRSAPGTGPDAAELRQAPPRQAGPESGTGARLCPAAQSAGHRLRSAAERSTRAGRCPRSAGAGKAGSIGGSGRNVQARAAFPGRNSPSTAGKDPGPAGPAGGTGQGACPGIRSRNAPPGCAHRHICTAGGAGATGRGRCATREHLARQRRPTAGRAGPAVAGRGQRHLFRPALGLGFRCAGRALSACGRAVSAAFDASALCERIPVPAPCHLRGSHHPAAAGFRGRHHSDGAAAQGGRADPGRQGLCRFPAERGPADGRRSAGAPVSGSAGAGAFPAALLLARSLCPAAAGSDWAWASCSWPCRSFPPVSSRPRWWR